MTVEEVRALVFAAVSAMVGLGLGIPNAIAIWRGVRAEGWRLTKGRIVESGLTLDHYSRDKDITRGPRVQYTFQAFGQTLTGNRISFARSVPVLSEWSTPLFGPPADVMAGLREGDEVDVWFDPEDPSRAVLRPGVDYGFVLLVLFGAGCLYLSVTLLLRVLAP